MLAEEGVANAEAALDLPLARFLTWCVHIEARYERRAAAAR